MFPDRDTWSLGYWLGVLLCSLSILLKYVDIFVSHRYNFSTYLTDRDFKYIREKRKEKKKQKQSVSFKLYCFAHSNGVLCVRLCKLQHACWFLFYRKIDKSWEMSLLLPCPPYPWSFANTCFRQNLPLGWHPYPWSVSNQNYSVFISD